MIEVAKREAYIYLGFVVEGDKRTVLKFRRLPYLHVFGSKAEGYVLYLV
jgi:hypothetical protein